MSTERIVSLQVSIALTRSVERSHWVGAQPGLAWPEFGSLPFVHGSRVSGRGSAGPTSCVRVYLAVFLLLVGLAKLRRWSVSRLTGSAPRHPRSTSVQFVTPVQLLSA